MSDLPISVFFGPNALSSELSKTQFSSFKHFASELKNPKSVIIPDHEEDTIKKAKRTKIPYFSQAVHINSTRCDASIEFIQLLAIDIDDHESATRALNILNHSNNYFSDFSYLYYTTISSKPSSMRLRIVIRCNLTKDQYVPAVMTVCRKILKIDYDPMATKAAQIAFVPAYFYSKDLQNLKNHVFHANLPDEPLVITEDIIDYDLVGQLMEKKKIKYDDVIPRVEMPLLEVSCRLKTLDSSFYEEYEKWISVIMMVHHSFNGLKSEDKAIDLLDRWSRQSVKYKTGDVERKWDSATEAPIQSPITLRSLIFYTKETDWEEKYLAERFKQISNQLEGYHGIEGDKHHYFNSTMPGIIAKYKFSDIQVDMLVEILCMKYTESFNGSIKINAGHKKKIRNACVYKGTLDNKLYLPYELSNMTYMVTEIAKPFFNPDSNTNYPITGFIHLIHEYSPVYRNVDFSNITLEREFDLPAVEESGYAPALPTLYREDGKLKINTFRVPNSLSTKPDHLQSDFERLYMEAFNTWLQWLIPDEIDRGLLLSFMAHCIFNLGDKILWVPIITTFQGAGKGLLSGIVELAIGPRNFKTTTYSAIKENETANLTGAGFILIDEASNHIPGRQERENLLKTFITNYSVSYKNKNVKELRNNHHCTNYMIFSNESGAVSISNDDRRYYPIESFPIGNQAVQAFDKELGKKIHENIEEYDIEIPPIIGTPNPSAIPFLHQFKGECLPCILDMIVKYHKNPHHLFDPGKLPRLSSVKKTYQEASRTEYENSFLRAVEQNDTIEVCEDYVLPSRFFALISDNKREKMLEQIIRGCTMKSISIEDFNPHLYEMHLIQYEINNCPMPKHMKAVLRKNGYEQLPINNGQMELNSQIGRKEMVYIKRGGRFAALLDTNCEKSIKEASTIALRNDVLARRDRIIGTLYKIEQMLADGKNVDDITFDCDGARDKVEQSDMTT